MDWTAIVLRFLHIGGGAAWLGASLFANLVVLPFIAGQPPDRRPQLVERLILAPETVIIGSALVSGVSGLILGIEGRGFASLDALATPAGVIWLAAIGVALIVFGAGGRITSPAARHLRQSQLLEGDLGGSAHAVDESAELERAFGRLRLGFRVELAGIVAILALMVVLPRV
jgi:hypothetical protein